MRLVKGVFFPGRPAQGPLIGARIEDASGPPAMGATRFKRGLGGMPALAHPLGGTLNTPPWNP